MNLLFMGLEIIFQLFFLCPFNFSSLVTGSIRLISLIEIDRDLCIIFGNFELF